MVKYPETPPDKDFIAEEGFEESINEEDDLEEDEFDDDQFY